MYALSAWGTGSCLWDESEGESLAPPVAAVYISHPAAYPILWITPRNLAYTMPDFGFFLSS